jgi:hypothetical protein
VRHDPKPKTAVAYCGLLDGMKSDIKPAVYAQKLATERLKDHGA